MDKSQFYVYILQSLKDFKTYTGYTDNIERRLKQHNNGQVKSTKTRVPFKILFTEVFSNLEEAKKRELWWKSSTGRQKLKILFEENKW